MPGLLSTYHRSGRVMVLRGVYAPQEDTLLLSEALGRERVGAGTSVLDVGTGSGFIALAAARRGARVTAVDRTRRAVLATRLNAALAGLRVEAVRGDLLTPAGGRRFDLILSNPPYVPAPDAAPPRRGSARAWDAGKDGRLVIDRLCAGAAGLLRPGGVLLLVHSALCGIPATLERLERAGLSAQVTDRRSVPFGPVLASRRQWLLGCGLIASGDDKEELVIIRAERIE
ncbi:HemK2/MTQ2 family protein methyltransferase [Streptomyces laculatispora]|uniref:HemK2/MTQ2 family protein methyltransferase n=1 Tax=Streptomyces laculatispora TaxID=887464 RepID=UPI001A950CA9|nr:HemK2/MTQ2 family protein methyltransferase [Streptomyces laculatispora]MBO0915446.1 methyltransferase [Streptomyces laculatispora]